MKVNTAWIKPPPAVSGLDHLAVQEPCINIYAQLLPGITNVTDRARYFSFYPWFVWAFDQSEIPHTDQAFKEFFRRADCLFTLIAERHARKCGDQALNDDDGLHGGRMVGRDTLLGPLEDLEDGGKPIRLSDFATCEDVPSRYFKNDLGGLGQYYLSTLRELGLLDNTAGKTPRYTLERGSVLAEAMDRGVDRRQFFSVLQKDYVTLSALDDLQMFCPCQLTSSSEEHRILIDIFFERNENFQEEGRERRRGLGLILKLVEELAACGDRTLDQFFFRDCVYSGCLPNRKKWLLPDDLEDTRMRWAIYQRNELLSIATQGLFCATLDAMQQSGIAFLHTRQFVEWFIASEDMNVVLDGCADLTWEDAVETCKDSLPPMSHMGDEKHELDLGYSVEAAFRNGRMTTDRQTLLFSAMKVLLALCARDKTESDPYERLTFEEDYFVNYPINLSSLRILAKETWATLTMREVLAWLVLNWGLELHLRVALRKLRYQTKDTFRFRPTDMGLEVVEVPQPVLTNPRFRQALQILRDINAVELDNVGIYRLTCLGRELLEQCLGQ